jgi:cytochrome c oxidase subunit 2
LPDLPPTQTIDGNVKAGAGRYVVCAYCHGTQGQGIEAMNAPRLAGMTDWYLAHQLNNFKQGIRGEHPEDYYGKQMGYMGRILQDDQAINDVVAYINTLPPPAAESVASAPRP